MFWLMNGASWDTFTRHNYCHKRTKHWGTFSMLSVLIALLSLYSEETDSYVMALALALLTFIQIWGTVLAIWSPWTECKSGCLCYCNVLLNREYFILTDSQLWLTHDWVKWSYPNPICLTASWFRVTCRNRLFRFKTLFLAVRLYKRNCLFIHIIYNCVVWALDNHRVPEQSPEPELNLLRWIVREWFPLMMSFSSVIW